MDPRALPSDPPPRDPAVVDVPGRLATERQEVVLLRAALAAELDGILDSVLLANNDDEHDPDGATNGYERAKATAMLHHAEGRLVEIDRALERFTAGTYGRCEGCGSPIGAERLEVLPTTTRCARCAA